MRSCNDIFSACSVRGKIGCQSAIKMSNGLSSASTSAQPLLPRRTSAETLAGLRCLLVGETDTSYACPICSRVLRSPQLTDCCGNHFCTSCLSRWLQMSSSCPLCRQVGFKSIRDKKIERAVQDMEVSTPFITH